MIPAPPADCRARQSAASTCRAMAPIESRSPLPTSRSTPFSALMSPIKCHAEDLKHDRPQARAPRLPAWPISGADHVQSARCLRLRPSRSCGHSRAPRLLSEMRRTTLHVCSISSTSRHLFRGSRPAAIDSADSWDLVPAVPLVGQSSRGEVTWRSAISSRRWRRRATRPSAVGCQPPASAPSSGAPSRLFRLCRAGSAQAEREPDPHA